MNNIRQILDKHAYNPYRYTIRKGVTIVDTDSGHFVFKRNKGNNQIDNLYKYLKSRSFEYYPKLVHTDDDYHVFEYIEEIETPKEQKANDVVHLLTLLHNKTTYYKEMDIDEYKAIYEDIISKLDYLYNYYTDIITMIESNVYMSPSQYVIARHISKIYDVLMFCRSEIDKWYEIINSKTKKRMATIHNNIDLDHMIRNNDLYLLSWDKAKVDIPIYDLYTFYKRYALELDFSELLKLYESKYPLHDEEKKLLLILFLLPEKFEFNNDEYQNCKQATKMVEYIYKTEILLKPYYTEQNIKEKN
jgi:hypothetical protein